MEKTMTEPQNLMDGLFSEMNRVREIIKQYESLPNNAGFIAASMMKIHIQKAESSIKNNDVIDMLRCYSDLKTWEQ